jgi:di/tripeptidase
MWLNLEQTGRTLDGSQIGELEYENFNAAGKILSKEKRTSWLCQRKMINSMLIANDFINELPLEKLRRNKGYEGFFHVPPDWKYRRNCFGINHSLIITRKNLRNAKN